MTKTETLHIRVAPIVKKRAEETLNELGLSITDAINVFLTQVILQQGIPFEVKKPRYNKETEEAIKEAIEMEKSNTGKIYNGFDEVLKELNE